MTISFRAARSAGLEVSTATVCKQDKGWVRCNAPSKQRAQFGTMNPRQHSSAALTAESLGREKVTLKNGPQELNKLELRNDTGTWQLWFSTINGR